MSLEAHKKYAEWERARGRERSDLWRKRESDLENTAQALNVRLADALVENRELVKRIVSMQRIGFVHVPTERDEEPYAMTNEYELEVEKSRVSNWHGTQTDPL